jgi:hypothetical protein
MANDDLPIATASSPDKVPILWTRFSNWLYQASNGWVALLALIVFLLFAVLVLPGQSAQAENEMAQVGSPDLSLWYSPRQLYGMAEAYGEQGRRAYVRARFTFDLIWPLVYGAFLSTAVSWLYAKALTAGSRWRWINLVPPLGVAFDYLENLSTSLVMLRYPSQTPLVDILAPLFTLIKWALVGGSFALLLAGIACIFARITAHKS